MEKDITNIVERFEAFEERLGITLEGVFAKINDDGELTVCGEVYAVDGTKINEDIDLIVSLHDASGRVIYRDHHYILASKFYGFESFKIIFYDTSLPVSKVRLYPKVI